MIINNFELIKASLVFADDLFYWVQIIKRRKENPGMETGQQIVDSFYIDSIDKFERYKQKIMDVCQARNARAYIYLNRRSYTRVAFRTAKIIADYLECGQYQAVKNAYQSACGQTHAETEKKWVVDIDDKEAVVNLPTVVHMKVPTINGYHLIVKPFDRRLIPMAFDIQPDGPTILYYAHKA